MCFKFLVDWTQLICCSYQYMFGIVLISDCFIGINMKWACIWSYTIKSSLGGEGISRPISGLYFIWRQPWLSWQMISSGRVCPIDSHGSFGDIEYIQPWHNSGVAGSVGSRGHGAFMVLLFLDWLIPESGTRGLQILSICKMGTHELFFTQVLWR